MKRNILTIGDIHGRTLWKDFIFGSLEKFEDWAFEVSGEYVRPWVDVLDSRFSDIDAIVFVGDYFDSFNVDNLTMKKNAEDIFLFKASYPDRVFLLYGNHDVQYDVPNNICSGHRPEMHFDFKEILMNNRRNIQVAHQEGNVLWTHAGITKYFYEHMCLPKAKKMKEEMDLANQALDGEFRSFELDKRNIAEFLNMMWEFGWDPLFNVGKRRGGFSSAPGPFWCDKSELINDHLPDVHQFVGHTPVDEIKSVYLKDFTVCFVDCLERGTFRQVAVVTLEDGEFLEYNVVEK